MLRSDRGEGGGRCAAAGRTDVAGGADGGVPVPRESGRRTVNRRGLLRWAGTAAVAAPAAGLLAACGGSSSSASAARKVRLGYVTSRTGAFRSHSVVDSYVVQTMRTILADGVKVGNRTYPVEIFVRDSESDRHGAGIATTDLIFKDKVDIVLVGGTSDTAVPVADQCEINQVPCISTIAPWQAWWNGRGGNVDMPFRWTYHFFWGMEDLVATYVAMWSQLGITKVGLMYPDDDDGRAFANPDFGIPTIRNYNNLRLTSPMSAGYASGAPSFKTYIDEFEKNGVQAVVGVSRAADFATFRKETRTFGYSPNALTISKAIYFQEDVRGLGTGGDGLTTEVAWSPAHPFRSSLTNKTSLELANDFTSARGQGWTQILGFSYALFEIAVKALSNVDSLDNREAVATAIRDVDAQTIVGPVAFGAQPNVPKNVARIALVGGQWNQNQQANDFDLKIVNNTGNTKVPLDAELRKLPPPV
ncbi:ABC transporter substrate-binding protein [Frankia sp. BMG5.23]|uniref:ABC transporter substrate-binding protein n=1 Tax=Frankia sp. BMG5.23 TaxID=683305 RepID=UPI00046136C3|nr:ABC transporter substrate-binding protein [Frankia sp. BMG5.23]KDA45062.1 amino acid/amide ABC transporter substrate-binding protein, HAAT family [Frankia sp. BMG5.23]